MTETTTLPRYSAKSLTIALAIMLGLWLAQSWYNTAPVAPDLSSDSYKAYVAEHKYDHARMCENKDLFASDEVNRSCAIFK